LEARFSTRLSESDTVGLNVQAFTLDSDGGNDADYYQGSVFWTKRVSQATVLDTQVGVTRVDAGNGNTGTGFLASLRGATNFRKGELVAQLQRTIFPDAFGSASESDLLELSYRYRLTKFISARLQARGERRRQSTGGSAGFNYDRATIEPNLVWQWRPQLATTLSYSYQWIERMGDESLGLFGTAEGHSGGISIQYTPKIRSRR